MGGPSILPLAQDGASDNAASAQPLFDQGEMPGGGCLALAIFWANSGTRSLPVAPSNSQPNHRTAASESTSSRKLPVRHLFHEAMKLLSGHVHERAVVAALEIDVLVPLQTGVHDCR